MGNKDKLVNVYKRFLAEVDAMIHNNHENIVKFKQALRDAEGDLYIIMDYCETDLYHKIKKDIEERGSPIEEKILVDFLR